MKKLFILTTLTFILTACGDSPEEIARKNQEKILTQQQQIMQQQAEQNQLIAQQQQYSDQQQQQQQQYVPQQQQPVIIQQPATQQTPVIVQQPSGHSAMTDMLVGGLIGHSLANMGGGNNRSTDVYHHNAPDYGNGYNSSRQVTNVTKNVTINKSVTTPSVTPAPIAPKPNYMDMNKLSQSSSYKPPVPASKPSGGYMNMNKLSSSSSYSSSRSFSSSSRKR